MRRMGGLGGVWCAVAFVCGAVAQAQGVDGGARAGDGPANAAIQTRRTAIPDSDSPERVARMDAILRRWEAVSQQNQTLYASFKRVDETKFGTTTFVGTALFRKPNLACLDWNEVVSSDKGEQSQVFTERIVCGNDRVYQMIGPTKQVIVYPLPQDARRRQLEEGPVPFLFNMQMQQAKARYHWRLLLEEPGKEGGAGKLYIEIVPLQKIDMEEFSKAWIILNDQSLLPEALQLFAPNGGKDKRTYTFGGVQRNGTGNLASNPVNFDGAAMAEVFRSKYGYKVIVNQANADPGAQLGARPAPAASPAPERSRRR